MKRNHQGGAQAVEFALVLPFLILIIFTVLDFGILVYNKAIITNASREAVRKAIELSATWSTATIQQVACNYAKSTLISVGATGTHTASCGGTADPVINVYSGANANCPSPSGAVTTPTPQFGDPVAVTVSYDVRGFSLGTWWSLGVGANSVGAPINLTSCTQMNHE